MNKYIYKFYSEVNYAETCRDADDIHIKDLGYFTSFKKTKEFIIDYLRKKLNYVIDTYNFSEDFRKQQREETEEILSKLKIKFNENNKWCWTRGGSWATFYYLEKVKIN